MTQEETALRIHIEKLELQLEQMKLLATTTGFFNAYFEELKKSATNTEAFNTVNERYHKLFGLYRYSDYNTFRVVKNRNIKK